MGSSAGYYNPEKLQSSAAGKPYMSNVVYTQLSTSVGQNINDRKLVWVVAADEKQSTDAKNTKDGNP